MARKDVRSEERLVGSVSVQPRIGLSLDQSVQNPMWTSEDRIDMVFLFQVFKYRSLSERTEE